MTGYALEVKLIRWTCDCKSHSPSGMCYKPKSHRESSDHNLYLGSFFHGLRTKRQREERFHLVQEFVDKLDKERL